LDAAGLFNRLELSTVDMRFHLRPKHSIHPQVALVLIGDKMLEEYGLRLSREYYAIIAKALLERGAKAVGFDMFFDLELDLGDYSLSGVTESQNNIVHAMQLPIPNKPPTRVLKDDRLEKFALKGEIQGKEKILRTTGKGRLLPYDSLLRATKFLGNVSSILESDNSVRRYPMVVEHAENYYPVFGLLLACRALDVPLDGIKIKIGGSIILKDEKGKEISIPIDNKGQMGINYVGGLESFKLQYQFYDLYKAIMSDSDELALFKDKVVVVGVYECASTEDVCPTPFARRFPGVGVHATIVSNILQGDFIKYTGTLNKVVLLVVFAFLAVILQILLPPKPASIALALLLICMMFIAWFSFSYMGTVINVTQPLFGTVFAFGGSMFYSYIDEKRRAKKLHDIFERQVSPEILARLETADEGLVPGERRKLTMLFSDIKGFTTWSEQLQPEELVAQMNEYFQAMLENIISNGGVINKFIGDAIVALFGMDESHEGEAPLQAIKAGLSMHESLKRLNKERESEDLPSINMRVGINTGEVAIGSIGTKQRSELTVMGDNVNLAQRTEGECEPGRVAITEYAYEEVKDKIETESLGLRQLKGKTQAVTIYHVLGMKKEE